MLKAIKNKILAISGVVAMLGAVGCNNSDAPNAPVVPGPDLVNLCLDVAFDGQPNSTRAGDNDGDGYEQATGLPENVKTLRVIIIREVPLVNQEGDTVKENGKPVIEKRVVEANRLVTTSEEGHPKYDNLEFQVVDNETKRIYLIANETSLTPPPGQWSSAFEFLTSEQFKVGMELANYDELTNWTVSISNIPDNGIVTNGIFANLNADVTGGPTLPLPLTEFFDIFVNVKRLQLPDDTYTSHLFMTRAAAKATFFLNPQGLAGLYDNVKITSISLSGIGSEEYVFPNNAVYSKGKYQNTKVPDVNMYINSFSAPSTNRNLTYLINTDFAMVPAGVDLGTSSRQINAVPIYFPESILKTGEKYMVTVTLSTGVSLSAPLVTNILNFGGCDAVARNTHLKIDMSFTSVTMTAQATVFPYTAVTLNPEFGFSAPESDKLTLAPNLTLTVGGPGALLTATYTSSEGNTIDNLYWVSSDPSVILLGNKITDDHEEGWIRPSASIELPYEDAAGLIPVRVIPQQTGKADILVYTQTGLVAKCSVTVN